jgi:regulatory protein
MTNTITDIQSLEDDPNYRIIFVNNEPEITIPSSTAKQLALQIGQIWTSELANTVQSFEDIEQARSMALRLISMKAWGVHELAARLVRRGIDREVATRTTEQLDEDGWLDDVSYARARIRDWTRIEPASRSWLRKKLHERKLSEETISASIEEELGDRNEQDAATELATIRIAKGSGLGEATLRRRVISALSRRGFSTDVGSEAMRRAQAKNT